MKYLNEWRNYIEFFLRDYCQKIKNNSININVLEIGVGTSTNIIREYFPNSVIIDNWIHESWKNVRMVDLCSNIPKDMLEYFDLIICCEVLEHTKQPWIAAESLTKMLRKNGGLLVTVPSLFEYHAGDYYGDYWRFMPGHIEYLFPYLKILYQNNAIFNGNLTGMVYVLTKH